MTTICELIDNRERIHLIQELIKTGHEVSDKLMSEFTGHTEKSYHEMKKTDAGMHLHNGYLALIAGLDMEYFHEMAEAVGYVICHKKLTKKCGHLGALSHEVSPRYTSNHNLRERAKLYACLLEELEYTNKSLKSLLGMIIKRKEYEGLRAS